MDNKIIARRLLFIVFAMLSLSYASVPLYDLFCRVTGYGGTTTISSNNNSVILEDSIRIRFDSNKEKILSDDLLFIPKIREVELKIGQDGLIFYKARNNTDKRIKFTTSFNVTPYSAGNYFVKVECFCFVEQSLEPNEEIEMPVSFYIDPSIIHDAEAKYINTITLSYTAYMVDD